MADERYATGDSRSGRLRVLRHRGSQKGNEMGPEAIRQLAPGGVSAELALDVVISGVLDEQQL